MLLNSNCDADENQNVLKVTLHWNFNIIQILTVRINCCQGAASHSEKLKKLKLNQLQKCQRQHIKDGRRVPSLTPFFLVDIDQLVKRYLN